MSPLVIGPRPAQVNHSDPPWKLLTTIAYNEEKKF